MSPEEQVSTLLSAVEPASVAAQDAVMLMSCNLGNPIGENRLRARLLAIERERGLSPTDLDAVWEFFGIERGAPSPIGT